MRLLRILFTVAAAVSVLIPVLHQFKRGSPSPPAICNDTSDPSATACMRFSVEWAIDINQCVTLAVRAETLLKYERFAPLQFACTPDDDGNTLIELFPIDAPPCGNPPRDGTGGFLISFNTADSDAEAKALNADLHNFFPSVDQFNCQSVRWQQPTQTTSPPTPTAIAKRKVEASSLAARQAVPDGPRAIQPNTQACRAINNGLYNNYYLQVGVKFDAERCHVLGWSLDSHRRDFREYHCKDDGFGGTFIDFVDTINGAGIINESLEWYFPTVNGFNCPDY